MIASVKKKISIKYKPLRTMCNIEYVGSICNRQNVSVDDNGTVVYSPDFTLTPFVAIPKCYAIEEGQTAVLVNDKLTNLTWYKIENGVKTLITASTTGFSIVPMGDTKGALTMSRNCEQGVNIDLIFHAEYVDSRTGDVYVYDESFLVITTSETPSNPKLTLDSPVAAPWNPTRDTRATRTRVITAKLDRGGNDLTNNQGVAYFWYRVDKSNLSNPKEYLIASGSNEPRDLDVVSVNKNVLTLNLERIGSNIGGVHSNEVTIVCRAGYSNDGVAPTTPSSNIAPQYTTIKRKIPEMECNYHDVADTENTDVSLRPKATVKDTLGILPDAQVERDLRCDWLTSTDGGANYKNTHSGVTGLIPMDSDIHLKLVIDDRDSYRYLTTNDGSKLILNSAGKVILARK